MLKYNRLGALKTCVAYVGFRNLQSSWPVALCSTFLLTASTTVMEKYKFELKKIEMIKIDVKIKCTIRMIGL